MSNDTVKKKNGNGSYDYSEPLYYTRLDTRHDAYKAVAEEDYST